MEMNVKTLLTLLMLFVSLKGSAQMIVVDKNGVSPTKYDYTSVARQITEGCATKYDQAKAIYRWLCANISYDTTYSIYTADECWEQRRGVCQAYSELFYRLGEPLGLKVRIISGTSKTEDDPAGSHAWVFVVTEGRSTGILIDPTWGAGTVKGKVFTRNDNDMSWFHVDPHWMIFTHFPDDPDYQLLSEPVSRQQFDALPILRPMLSEYGFNATDMFRRCMAGQTGMPQIYETGRGYVRMVQAPLEKELRIGTEYVVGVQLLRQCEPALVNKDFYKDWVEQDGVIWQRFVPTVPGEASLNIRKPGEKSYWTVLEYRVPQPTQADLARLEQRDPLLMPEIERLKNLNKESLRQCGVDGKKLLDAVRAGRVTALPVIYRLEGKLLLDDVPLDETLRVGQTYTFRFRPYYGKAWAVINEDDWYLEWSQDPETGAWVTSVTPQKAGTLKLSVQTEEGGDFWSCLKYVVRP